MGLKEKIVQAMEGDGGFFLSWGDFKWHLLGEDEGLCSELLLSEGRKVVGYMKGMDCVYLGKKGIERSLIDRFNSKWDLEICGLNCHELFDIHGVLKGVWIDAVIPASIFGPPESKPRMPGIVSV